MWYYLFLLISSSVLAMAVRIDKAEIQSIDKNYLNVEYKVYDESGISKVDIDSDIIQDLNDGLFMQVIIEKKVGANYIQLYKSDVIDKCHFAENKDKYPVEKALTNDFTKYGNMLQSCPVKKGHYYLKGFIINEKDLAAFDVKPGEYKIHYTQMKEVGSQKNILFSIIWFVTV